MLVEKAVCMHEEDTGLLWKHVEYRTNHSEVRRSRRLVLSFVATVRRPPQHPQNSDPSPPKALACSLHQHCANPLQSFGLNAVQHTHPQNALAVSGRYIRAHA